MIELYRKDFPQRCIDDCTIPGQDAYQSIHYWMNKLNFHVDRVEAIACLKPYGAWADEEIEECSNEELNERILWIAMGDFAENENEEWVILDDN